MKTVLHKADSRGYADHGWLKTHHTFSFSNYYNPDRVNFGALRVLNDDYVSGGMGFGKHPHRDMEIITIPLEGELKHGDDMGNHGVISKNEIQIMSAGSGIVHSELNASAKEAVKFLQIWIMPNEKNVTPRYDQISLKDDIKNEFQQILSPNRNGEGSWIHQDVWMNTAKLDEGITKNYSVHRPDNGVYIFVISGKVKIEDQVVDTRDGLGIMNSSSFDIETLEKAQILLIEVPMDFSYN